MKQVTALFFAAVLSGCSTLPDIMYDSPDKARNASNFELCRAALNPDSRLQGTQNGVSAIEEQVSQRGLNRDSCFDVLLGEHGSSTMCRRYQRALARGEPTALVGFATDLSVQDLERGLARNNLPCAPRTVNTESGWGALSRQVDRFNDSMTDSYRQNRTTSCYEVYEGKVRCYQN